MTKKRGLIFIVLLVIFLYVGNYIFSPTIEIINNSDKNMNINFYQYLGIIDIESSRIEPADTQSVDYIAINKSIILQKGGSKTFRSKLSDIRSNEPKKIDLLEIYWNDAKYDPVEYAFLKDKQKKNICSLVITVDNNNYTIEEKTNKFCLRGISRVVY